MIIQKMNNALVKHGKVTFTFFTIIIIISFVWYFAPGRDGSMFFGGMRGSNSKYGEVLGKNITVGDVNNAAQVMSTYFAVANPYVKSYIDEEAAFRAAVRLKAADVLGVQASDKEVSDRIQSIGAFLNQDGTFSRELYDKYQNEYLKPEGKDCSDLEDAVRTMIRMEKLPNMMCSSVVVSDVDAQNYAEMMLSGISYHRISFSPDSFADQVGDIDLNAYYEAHKASYRSLPEYDGVLVYAPYTVQKSVTPDEDQVRDFYEAQKETLYKNEDGTIRPFEEVKDEILKEKTSTKEERVEESAKKSILDFHAAFLTAKNADVEAYEDDPQKNENLLRLFREEAEKAGLRIREFNNITRETEANPGLYLDGRMVAAITGGSDPTAQGKKRIGDFTQPIEGDVCSSMFMITGYRPDEELPFEKVKDKVAKDAIEQKKQELAGKAAVEFAQAFEKIEKLEDRAAGIEALATSLHGVLHEEETTTRLLQEKDIEMMQMFVMQAQEQGVDLSPMLASFAASRNAVLITDVGEISSPYTGEDAMTGKDTTEFIFVTAHKPATAEEVAAQKERLAVSLKNKRQDIASLGLINWLNSTVKAPAGKQQEQR